MKYNQLTYENYIEIQGHLKYTENRSLIASCIGHNKSSVSRLLKPFKDKLDLFDAGVARNNKLSKRNEANQLFHKIQVGSELESKILDEIKLFHSPEQVSGRYKEKYNEYMSPQTIYSHIYEHYNKKDDEDNIVKLNFRRKGKKYKKSKADKIKVLNRKIIDISPEIIELNTEIGHFEGDTIVGSDKRFRILTLVDRKSNMLFAKLIKPDEYEKPSFAVSRLSIEIFKQLGDKVKTSTNDNGTEFADHEHITEQTGVDIYFAHPYSSRERGCNENTNGL